MDTKIQNLQEINELVQRYVSDWSYFTFFLNMVNDMYFSVAQVCLIDCSILLIYFGYILFYKYRLIYLKNYKMLSWIYLAAVEGVNFMNNFDKLMINKKIWRTFFQNLLFPIFYQIIHSQISQQGLLCNMWVILLWLRLHALWGIEGIYNIFDKKNFKCYFSQIYVGISLWFNRI